MLKIITAPNPILSGNSNPVAKIDKSVLSLIKEMEQALLSAKDPEGVGLAAPQVGKSLRLFITKPTPKSKIQVFINPKIETEKKINDVTFDDGRGDKLHPSLGNPRKKSHAKLEGCLSLPNIWGNVNRPPIVTLSYLDEKAKTHTKTFRGLFSTIIQHEIDHLNGILFPKRVLEQKGKLYKSHKDEKGEDVFEEIEI